MDFSPMGSPTGSTHTLTATDGLVAGETWQETTTFADLSALGDATVLTPVSISDYPAAQSFNWMPRFGTTCAWGVSVGDDVEFSSSVESPVDVANVSCAGIAQVELASQNSSGVFYHPRAGWPNGFKPFIINDPPHGDSTGCGTFKLSTSQTMRGMSCLLTASAHTTSGATKLTLTMMFMLRFYTLVNSTTYAYRHTSIGVPYTAGTAMVGQLFPNFVDPGTNIAGLPAWYHCFIPWHLSTLTSTQHGNAQYQQWSGVVSCGDLFSGVELSLTSEYTVGPQALWSAIGITNIPSTITLTAA
jgi:hypothetical protein